MLHDPNNIWVAANVKETELARFGVGASASVTVDAFPSQPIVGRISWIGPVATSQFALIPNANPSGNFTKVTQRIPIRIDLELTADSLQPARLRPGMMVEVAIDAE